MDLPAPYVEPSPRRVRVRAGDVVLADSRGALLVAWYRRDQLPTYALPPEDVRLDLLQPSAAAAPLSHRSVHDVAGEVGVPAVAHRFEDVPPWLEPAAGRWTFAWDSGVSWFEEALEVHVHARDPHKRVDVVPSDRHVRVELDGVLLAESRGPHALFETTLPIRWYLPVEDVRMDRLEPSDLVTRCPYKGTAAYWSARTGAGLHQDVAWSYADPVIECPRIAGLVCFFNEQVDLTVDGERLDRPRTPWSQPDD